MQLKGFKRKRLELVVQQARHQQMDRLIPLQSPTDLGGSDICVPQTIAFKIKSERGLNADQ